MKFFIFLPILLFSTFSSGQTIGERLTAHQSQYPLEKIYIAHDRPYYAPGDTIWCQAHLVEGRSHLTFENSPLVYVDWYNEQEECVRSIILKITNGTAAFEIPTNVNDTTGSYQIRAYTQYQQNFEPEFIFQKTIMLTEGALSSGTITNEVSDFSLQFFSEGGFAVNGLSGKVSFQALDQDGAPIEVSGILRDQNNQTISAVKAIHQGIGVFSYSPENGRQYEVVCTYKGVEKTFSLPEAIREGYQLSVNNRDESFIEVTVRSSPGLTVNNLQLVGHLRGLVFLDKRVEGEQLYKLKIPRSNIPSGVLHLTLFDPKERPVAERLLFNRNNQEAVELTVNKNGASFFPKSRVELDLNAQLNKVPQKGKLSLSVYNAGLVKPQKTSGNIQSYLWLQSDIAEHLPDIFQYLEVNNSKTRVLLDYVLLTHGWRRFKWQEVLAGSPNISFPPQEHIAIAGKVTRGRKKEPVKADVFLNILSLENFASLNLTTEEDGLFIFQGFDFMDTTEMVLQANVFNPKKKRKSKEDEVKRVGKKDVDIEIFNLNELTYTAREGDSPKVTKTEELKYAEAVQNIRTVEAAYSGLIQADIEEVTVEASRLSTRREQMEGLKKEYFSRGLIFSPTSKKLFMDNLANKGQQYPDVFELIQANFPGVILDRTETFNKKVYLSNTNIRITQDVQPAILVIDGLTINQGLGATPPPIIPLDVKSIDVVSPNQASLIYGEQAIGGAVVILTREERVALGDQSETRNPGTISINHPGYYAAREFYKPDYRKAQKASAKPDLRTTIFWDPEIQIGEKINFFTGDQIGDFIIQIEGITDEGLPFVHWEALVVEAQ